MMQASSKIIIARLMEIQGQTPFRPEYFIEAERLLGDYEGFKEVLASAQTSDVITGTCRTDIALHYK